MAWVQSGGRVRLEECAGALSVILTSRRGPLVTFAYRREAFPCGRSSVEGALFRARCDRHVHRPVGDGESHRIVHSARYVRLLSLGSVGGRSYREGMVKDASPVTATDPIAGVNTALSAVASLFPRVEGVADADLVLLTGRVEQLGRIVDALRTRAAGEVSRRRSRASSTRCRKDSGAGPGESSWNASPVFPGSPSPPARASMSALGSGRARRGCRSPRSTPCSARRSRPVSSGRSPSGCC